MIKYDKLKLVADIEAVKITDESRFEIIKKKGLITSRKYYQETPFLLRIKMDYKRGESVIEFSGKILGRDYPKLISSDTIKQCFENINTLGFCWVDTSMMMDADVVKCDVTRDKTLSDFKQATEYIRSHICSYQKFICRKLQNGNVTIEKNVVSSKLKKRLTIYDKEQEMMRSENRSFCTKYGLEGTFQGLARFELNLSCKEQIRMSLHITDTKLTTVLDADYDPINGFLKEVVEEPTSNVRITDKKSYLTMLVLKDCDYDLEKVEAKMRGFCPSRGTSIKKVMEPYKAMMEQIGVEARRKSRQKSKY